MISRLIGGKTTTFAFDDANQLVSSTTDGVTTKYAYGLALDYGDDVTNAGLGALIINGCTHHWEAKFVKE